MAKYNLTQEGYDALFALGEQAQSILSQHTSPATLSISDWKDSLVNIVRKDRKERLDTSKLRKLFGTNYRGVVYFNMDSHQRWNCKGSTDYDTRNMDLGVYGVHTCKDILEREPAFADYEFVGPAVMEISAKKFPQMGKTINNPVHVPNGTAVVGTIITRDIRTGKICPIPDSWMAVDNAGLQSGALRRGAELFVNLIIQNEKFRSDLIQTLHK